MKHLMMIAAMLCGTIHAHPAWDALGITNRADVVRRRAEIREWVEAHPDEMAAWRAQRQAGRATAKPDPVARALAAHAQFVASFTNTHVMVDGKWTQKKQRPRRHRVETPPKKADPKVEKFRALRRSRKGR